MPYQQKSVRKQKLSHPGMNEDGLAELNEEALEIITGGKGAMARDQFVQAEIATLESINKSPKVVNIIQNNNVGVSQSSTGNVRTH